MSITPVSAKRTVKLETLTAITTTDAYYTLQDSLHKYTYVPYSITPVYL